MNSRVELDEAERENFFAQMAGSGPAPWEIDSVREWEVFEDSFIRCGFRVEGNDILYFFTHVENDDPHADRLQAMIDSGATVAEMREVEPASMSTASPVPLPLSFGEALDSVGREVYGDQFEKKLVLEMEVWWLRAPGAAKYVLKRNMLTLGFLEKVSALLPQLLRDLS